MDPYEFAEVVGYWLKKDPKFQVLRDGNCVVLRWREGGGDFSKVDMLVWNVFPSTNPHEVIKVMQERYYEHIGFPPPKRPVAPPLSPPPPEEEEEEKEEEEEFFETKEHEEAPPAYPRILRPFIKKKPDEEEVEEKDPDATPGFATAAMFKDQPKPLDLPFVMPEQMREEEY